MTSGRQHHHMTMNILARSVLDTPKNVNVRYVQVVVSRATLCVMPRPEYLEVAGISLHLEFN